MFRKPKNRSIRQRLVDDEVTENTESGKKNVSGDLDLVPTEIIPEVRVKPKAMLSFDQDEG